MLLWGIALATTKKEEGEEEEEFKLPITFRHLPSPQENIHKLPLFL